MNPGRVLPRSGAPLQPRLRRRNQLACPLPLPNPHRSEVQLVCRTFIAKLAVPWTRTIWTQQFNYTGILAMDFCFGDEKPEDVEILLYCNFLCHKQSGKHSHKNLVDTILIQLNTSNTERHIEDNGNCCLTWCRIHTVEHVWMSRVTSLRKSQILWSMFNATSHICFQMFGHDCTHAHSA